MDRLIRLVCRPNKSVTPTNYFFKVPIIGRFMPLVCMIPRPVESWLHFESKNDLTNILDLRTPLTTIVYRTAFVGFGQSSAKI